MAAALKISNEKRVPIYVQIANQFKAMIRTGELKEVIPGNLKIIAVNSVLGECSIRHLKQKASTYTLSFNCHFQK